MKLSKDKAQAVTELAVFGAILLFVIGGIVRVSMQAGMEQNQNLKAMRWALLQSLYGVYDKNKSRDSASVLLIEDRLDPRPDKFGSLDRVPLIASGSGTMSNTIFMPMDWLENYNVPVTDVFVNGQHFVFSTARFIMYDIQLVTNAALPEDASHVGEVRVWDLTNNIKTYLPKEGNWHDHCKVVNYGTDLNTCNAVDTTQDLGCPLFYSVTPKNGKRYCDNSTCLDGSLSLDQRFDLNRNGDFFDDPRDADRENILWQWRAVKGIKSLRDLRIDYDNGIYRSFDIDGDRKEEVIYGINRKSSGKWQIPPALMGIINPFTGEPVLQIENTKKGIAQQIAVLDYQKGDMDLTSDDTDKLGPDAAKLRSLGLNTDASVYTLTKDGTYLEIKEGKAYVPGTDTFVRSVSKKDQLDLISRIFQLSNNTGRYCNGTAVVNPIGGVDPKAKGGAIPNPVKYCVDSANGGSCYSNVTSTETCYDIATNKLFIRSRIEDTRGRKWLTETK